MIAVIVLLGIGLVVASRASRDPIIDPLVGDHWHSAYEFYDCGTLLPTIADESGPDGIHSHGDSLFHIHPSNSSATGVDADLGVFFAAASLSVGTDLVVSNSPVDIGFPGLDTSTGCGDDDSQIVVGRWNVDGEEPELETVYTDDFAEIRFLHEREAFTIAKVAVGEDPPAPSEAVLAQLASTTGTTNLFSENPILPPLEGEDDGATDDGATDDGAVDDGVTDDGATDDVTTDDGTTDDGATDGTADDGATDGTDASTTDETPATDE